MEAVQNKGLKILLITEAVFVEESVGASRTLFNLLKDYPAENILLLSPKGSFKKYKYLKPFNQNNIFFTFNLLNTVRNRLAPVINPFVELLNLLWMEFQPLSYRKEIKTFSPDVILAVPLFKEGMIISRRMIQKNFAPAFVYLMDDWVTTNPSAWGINNIQNTAEAVLKNSKWLMISHELRDCFAGFFKISHPTCMVVHNPVNIQNYVPRKRESGKPFVIAYAGSIWDMHKDALILIAKAIKLLKNEGLDIKLVLYCQEIFYTQDKAFWDDNGTQWGGLISYKELNPTLQAADLLLVTTAFDNTVATLVKTSVLTKTTDYMNAGRPILAVGPPYSATNKFVKDWDAGYIIDQQDIEIVKKEILKIMNNEVGNSSIAYNSWLKLKENFTSEVINAKLTTFLNSK